MSHAFSTTRRGLINPGLSRPVLSLGRESPLGNEGSGCCKSTVPAACCSASGRQGLSHSQSLDAGLPTGSASQGLTGSHGP